jgi:hypothetical protein
MSILDPGHSWSEIKSELEKLSSLVPAGEVLELSVFGGATVLYWGMEGRLSRDVDVQQSRSSPFLMDLVPAAAGLIRHRDSEGPDPKGPYVEIAPPEADSYLPRFSVYECVPIAHNVILKLPAPAEIAASKVAFADRIDRTKDLQDIKFIQDKFGSRREEILQKLFTIERETHRRSAIMVWNQLERLIAEIPERQMEFEKKKEEVARLEDEALKRERLAEAEKLLRRQKRTPEQDQELGQSL